MPILILSFCLLFLHIHIHAQEVDDELIDEWDNKEIEIDHLDVGSYTSSVEEKTRNYHSMTDSSRRAESDRLKAKNTLANPTFKESTPITRPILYRYIYVNPRAEKRKAELRKKQEESKKAVVGNKK